MLEIERRERRCTMLLLPGRIADVDDDEEGHVNDDDDHINTAYNFCHCYNCTR